MELIDEHRSFGGLQQRYQHQAHSLDCDMTFSVFLPPAAQSRPVPVLYWLSGLTCTDENFVTKAGAQAAASELGIAIVAPDTSPRGDDVPDDPEAAYDFGLGAGFYVDASQAPWKKHYRMYSYISTELPELLASELPLDHTRMAISGHSMGGHGAMVIGLRNPQRYQSISAFAPICAPSQCPWGHKALGNYLGNDQELWKQYDATVLISTTAKAPPILIDQGLSDSFLQEQLRPQLLESAATATDKEVEVRYQAGYDHSYFFIASFITEHLHWHAQHLS